MYYISAGQTSLLQVYTWFGQPKYSTHKKDPSTLCRLQLLFSSRLGGLGTNWKSVFYGKLTRTTMPKILSVSLLTTKEHPYKVKKNLQGSFFIIYEKLKIESKSTFS